MRKWWKIASLAAQITLTIQTTVVLPSPCHVSLDLPKKVSKSHQYLWHILALRFPANQKAQLAPFQSPRYLLSWDAGNAHLALQPDSESKTRAFEVMKYLRYTIVTLHSRELSSLSRIAIHRPLESTEENEESHLGNLVGKGPCEFQR